MRQLDREECFEKIVRHYMRQIEVMKEFAEMSYRVIEEFDNMNMPGHERARLKAIVYEERAEQIREQARALMKIIDSLVYAKHLDKDGVLNCYEDENGVVWTAPKPKDGKHEHYR